MSAYDAGPAQARKKIKTLAAEAEAAETELAANGGDA
jgi:hypothetical protein